MCLTYFLDVKNFRCSGDNADIHSFSDMHSQCLKASEWRHSSERQLHKLPVYFDCQKTGKKSTQVAHFVKYQSETPEQILECSGLRADNQAKL